MAHGSCGRGQRVLFRSRHSAGSRKCHTLWKATRNYTDGVSACLLVCPGCVPYSDLLCLLYISERHLPHFLGYLFQALHHVAPGQRRHVFARLLMHGSSEAILLSLPPGNVDLCLLCRTTEASDSMIQGYLRQLAPKFNASTYNLMKNNCNNFSDALCEFLVGKGVPVRPPQLP